MPLLRRRNHTLLVDGWVRVSPTADVPWVGCDPIAHAVHAGVPVPAPWTVSSTSAGATIAAVVKEASGEPWSVVKRWIATGKVLLGGAAITAIDHRVRGGDAIEVRLAAPRPRDLLARASWSTTIPTWS